jgi:protein arginine N-methyltransferase 2
LQTINYKMSYLNQKLTFTDTNIHFTSSVGEKHFVMMGWEDNIMSASIAYVCENGGDILEIGFGMGISAGYIQSHSINSHTICECHPDVIPKAISWALDKPNVTIVSQSWYDAFLNGLETYDGIFCDPYLDETIAHFSSSLETLCNVGCKVTWWNNTRGQINDYGFDDSTITYDVLDCTPTINDYYKGNKYYLPKLQK